MWVRRRNATDGYNAGDHSSGSGLSTDSDGSSATMQPTYDAKRLVRLQTKDVTQYRVGQEIRNKGRQKNLNGVVVEVCVSDSRGSGDGEGCLGRVTIAPYADGWQDSAEAEDIEEHRSVSYNANEARRLQPPQQQLDQNHEQHRQQHQHQQPPQAPQHNIADPVCTTQTDYDDAAALRRRSPEALIHRKVRVQGRGEGVVVDMKKTRGRPSRHVIDFQDGSRAAIVLRKTGSAEASLSTRFCILDDAGRRAARLAAIAESEAASVAAGSSNAAAAQVAACDADAAAADLVRAHANGGRGASTPVRLPTGMLTATGSVPTFYEARLVPANGGPNMALPTRNAPRSLYVGRKGGKKNPDLVLGLASFTGDKGGETGGSSDFTRAKYISGHHARIDWDSGDGRESVWKVTCASTAKGAIVLVGLGGALQGTAQGTSPETHSVRAGDNAVELHVGDEVDLLSTAIAHDPFRFFVEWLRVDTPYIGVHAKAGSGR